MLDLLSLPNETLYRIVDYVDLGDLEHFAALLRLVTCSKVWPQRL